MDDWIREQQRKDYEIWLGNETIKNLKKHGGIPFGGFEEDFCKLIKTLCIITPFILFLAVLEYMHNFIKSMIGDYLPHFWHLDTIIPYIILIVVVRLFYFGIAYYLRHLPDDRPRK